MSAGYLGGENGFQSDKSFKTGHTFSNNGETWIEVQAVRMCCLRMYLHDGFAHVAAQEGLHADHLIAARDCFAVVQVAKTRLYTPQAEDVGALLKLDVVSCDTAGGYAREVSNLIAFA